jgi:hypothetical protein
MNSKPWKIIFTNRDMNKISGRKSPLIIGKFIAKVKNAYIYQKFHDKKVPVGMEFVFFQTKLNHIKHTRKRSFVADPIEESIQLKKNTSEFHIIGKILARSSSDLMVIIANRLLHTQKYKECITLHNLMLIQYPINSNDHIKRLILLSEIGIDSIQTDLEKIEELLYDFSESFRKILKKIAADNIKDDVK